MKNNLDDIDLAILRMIAKSQTGSQMTGKYAHLQVINGRFGVTLKDQVSNSIQKLLKLDYVSDTVQGRKAGVICLSPLGESALDSQQNIEISTFSNITNSAIAHKSTNVTQTINLNDLAPELIEKVKEFDDAVKEKNSSKMKAAFGYIADKSVDAAIALATGALVR